MFVRTDRLRHPGWNGARGRSSSTRCAPRAGSIRQLRAQQAVSCVVVRIGRLVCIGEYSEGVRLLQKKSCLSKIVPEGERKEEAKLGMVKHHNDSWHGSAVFTFCRSKKFFRVWRSQPRARLAPCRPWLLPRVRACTLVPFLAEAAFDIFPPLGPTQTAAPAMGGEGGRGGQPNEAWDEGGACSSCGLLPRPAALRARALQLSPGLLAHRLVGWPGLNRKAGRRPPSASTASSRIARRGCRG